MKTFLEWNDAISRHFFRPEHAGRSIYLYVTKDLIEEIGGEGSVPSFVESMSGGPEWATRLGLCQKALQTMEGWRQRGLEFPPYIGYLALFVLAAGWEGDFAVHAYYPRLRTLLGEEPVTGTYPSFGRMYELWDDLEKWLNIERTGSLGIFRADIAGSWPHVGLPTAQTILTQAERERLHSIFADAGVDPDFPPPDLELARMVRARGGGLRNRTLHALEDSRSEYGSVLIDRILEELESWQETSTAAEAAEEVGPAEHRGTAILCLPIVDEVAQRITMELRCRFPEPFPETVAVEHDGAIFTCTERAAGYSTAFSGPAVGRLNPANLNWQRGAVLRSPDSPLVVRWPASTVRVFSPARERGLPGFIEVPAFDPAQPFIIAAPTDLATAVRSWGERSCTRFRELASQNLPAGWAFFAGDRAEDDSLIRDIAPRLSFSADLRRIRLVGGIHVPGLQSYFRFAPPAIRLDGGHADERMTANGTHISRDDDGAFRIPDELLAEHIIVIEAGHLKRLIYLEDGGLRPDWTQRRYNAAGDIEEFGELPGVLPCGLPAAARETSAAIYAYPPDPLNGRATAVGHRAGEVAEFSTDLPFQPVWLVFHRGRDRQTAEYVAADLLEPVVPSGIPRAARQAWKEVLWHHRLRIDAPPFPPLRQLWLRYQKAAKDA